MKQKITRLLQLFLQTFSCFLSTAEDRMGERVYYSTRVFFLQIFLALVCVVRDYFGHVT